MDRQIVDPQIQRLYNVHKAVKKMADFCKRTVRRAVAAAMLLIWMIFLPGLPVFAVDDLPQKGLQGRYGEKQEIATAEDARAALKRYFSKKDVVIGEIVEKELYFEADIMDMKHTVIDKVIVDKRTGRIRSIY